MLAVGLWAAQRGGRARWGLPLAFVAAMIVGAALTQFGLVVPAVEQGIAASVLALGLLVAFAARLPLVASAGLVAVFASFHGAAHSAEMSAFAHPLSYGLGFAAATALLHASGLALGLVAPRFSPQVTRYTGWAIAACGVALLAV